MEPNYNRRRMLLIGAGSIAAASAATIRNSNSSLVFSDSFESTNAISVLNFGATGDGVTDDTAAIQSALDHMSNVKGILWFPPGRYMVSKNNPTGAGSRRPDDFALNFTGSGVTLVGQPGESVIVRNPSSPDFVTMRWQVLPIDNGVVKIYNSHITGLEFDGSIDPTEADSVGSALIVASGINNCSISNCYFHGSLLYGLALQNGGHVNTVLRDILVEDTWLDAIDVKNNGDNDKNNRMTNITCRRFGRGADPGTSVSAGIDIHAGWQLDNIICEDYGDFGKVVAGIRFKQGESEDSRGTGAHYSSLNNFKCIALDRNESSSTRVETGGIISRARKVQISNGYIRSPSGTGITINQDSNKVSLVIVEDCGIDGFETTDKGLTTKADKCSFVGCEAIRSGRADFLINTDNCSLSACIADGGDINLWNPSGGWNTRWIGGALLNAKTTTWANKNQTNKIWHAIKS